MSNKHATCLSEQLTPGIARHTLETFAEESQRESGVGQHMQELRKFYAPEFIFGAGARHRAGHYLRNLGAVRVLTVTDAGVAAAGWLEELRADWESSGIEAVVHAAVTPNPRADEVMAAARAYAGEGCDAVLALGGGSVIDCAKGVVVVAGNGGEIAEYEGIDTVPLPGPPLVAIPTTAGSAAEISQFAVYTCTRRREKIAVVSKGVVPDVALVDPELTRTLNVHQTACGGLDALGHAIEAYVSTASSPLVDGFALEAVRGVRNCLLRAIGAPDDMELRERLMLASLQAGLAFTNASLGVGHAMAHGLGGYLDIVHGEAIAMVLEPAIAFNYAAASQRFNDIGNAMGLDMHYGSDEHKLRRICDDLAALRSAVGLGRRLSDVGVDEQDVHELARRAARDVCIFTNPRRVAVADLEAIYADAL